MSTTRLGLLTDLHWAPPGTRCAWHNPYDFAGLDARLTAAFAHFAVEAVDLVALTGDLTHGGDEAATLAVVRRCAELTPAPIVAVGGNHDVSEDGDRLARAVAAVGSPAFTLAPPAPATPFLAGVHLAPGDGWFGSALREPPARAVAGWGDRPVVLLSHLPALSAASEIAALGLPYPGDLTDRPALEAALTARRAPTVVLSGHIHARTARALGPLLQLTQAALIEAPHECATVTVETDAGDVPGALRVTRRAIRVAPDRAAPAVREPLLAPAEQTWSFDPASARWTASRPDPHPSATERSLPCSAAPIPS